MPDGWPPPLQVEVKGAHGTVWATLYFDGPHHSTCSHCGLPARCGLSYAADGAPIPPDAVYVEGGEEPWAFHLDCIATKEGDDDA